MARLRGTRWQADAIVRGKRMRHTFSTQLEAEAWESAARLADEKNLPTPSVQGITEGHKLSSFIDEAVPFLWGGSANEMKAAAMAKTTAKFFGENATLESVRTPDVIRWITSLKREGNANATINRKISNLSKLLKHARKSGLITQVPEFDRQSEGEGRIRFLSDTEENKLIGLLYRWGQEPYAEYVKFLLYTGCRPSEAGRVEWRDVSANRVTFWHTKTKRPRTIPLSIKAKEAVDYTRLLGWLRPWSEISYFAFIKVWDRVKLQMGLDHDEQFVPYALRHTCASRLVQRGIDIRRVKEWMGHTSITMTMRYAHLSPTDLDEAVSVFDAVPKCAIEHDDGVVK